MPDSSLSDDALRQSADERGLDDALRRAFGGVEPLRLEEALFEAILVGWGRQQTSRQLSAATKRSRDALVRRFHAHAGVWPWEWRAEHIEEWIADLAAPPRRLAVSTLRAYQVTVRLFVEYLLDRRYPWALICEQRLGHAPRRIVDERNLIRHGSDYEGDPRRRPLTRAELVALFEHCDAQVTGRRALKRKGSLAAFRDAVLFKTIYAFGLRRQEAARLDVVDFTRNAHKASFGGFGALSVRYGKALAGGPPRRRTVLTVFDWSVEVLEQYVHKVRPLYGRCEHPALWLTERGGRIFSPDISERFARYRDEIGLPRELARQ